MTGRVGDLTTLATVKTWRSPVIATTTDDAQLQREITACSKFLLNYMQRDLITKTYVERRNSYCGQTSMMLRNRPIVSVSSVSSGNQIIPEVNNLTGRSCGFTYDNNPDPVYNTGMLYLNGYSFWAGQQTTVITYEAGLLVPDEEVTLNNTDFRVQCSDLFELWSAPYWVKYADGTLLTPVKAAPTTGQYIPAMAPDGFYQLSPGDGNADLLLTYSYTPKDIEAACVTTIILEYNRRARIGEDSKSIAGETILYSKRGLSEAAIDFLASFVEVTPVDP